MKLIKRLINLIPFLIGTTIGCSIAWFLYQDRGAVIAGAIGAVAVKVTLILVKNKKDE
jgi:hypothetical protein